MMNDEDRFEKLLSALPDKHKDSISMKVLSQRLEMTSREVRQYVLEARKKGFPFLSDGTGYWR